MTIQKQSKFKGLLPYIKLQTKLAFTSSKNHTKKRKIVNAILSVLVYALFLTLAFYFLRALVTQTDFVRGPDVMILIITLTQFILLITSITFQIKRLHKPDDLRIISTLPISTFQKYIGEIISIYIKLFIYCFLIFYPFVIVYGFAGSMLGSSVSAGANAAYIFSALFATILLPLLPFAVSLVISVPFMYLSSWLQNKNIIKFVLFMIVFIGLLVLYSFLLRFMSDWWIHAATDVEVIKGIASFLSAMNHPYNFCYFTSEICLHNHLGINFLILLGISLGFMLIGIGITKPLYEKFITSSSNLEAAATYKHVRITEGNPYKELFVKEVKQIIRTQTYAFFYLGVAFAMPILTYLIMDVIKALGQASTGSTMFFGFAMLILCVIISLIGSYSANVISKEGKEFYITKTIPLSYRAQLLTKASVNFAVSFFGLLLCIIVLGATATTAKGGNATLSVGDLFLLFGICTLFLIGITFNGVNINLIRPKVEVISGQPSESNVVIQLLISLAITTLICIFVMVMDGIFGSRAFISHIIILCAMLIYAGVNFLVFFFTAEKKYMNLEVK